MGVVGKGHLGCVLKHKQKTIVILGAHVPGERGSLPARCPGSRGLGQRIERDTDIYIQQENTA